MCKQFLKGSAWERPVRVRERVEGKQEQEEETKAGCEFRQSAAEGWLNLDGAAPSVTYISELSSPDARDLSSHTPTPVSHCLFATSGAGWVLGGG